MFKINVDMYLSQNQISAQKEKARSNEFEADFFIY